jgi:hypothetical protein
MVYCLPVPFPNREAIRFRKMVPVLWSITGVGLNVFPATLSSPLRRSPAVKFKELFPLREIQASLQGPANGGGQKGIGSSLEVPIKEAAAFKALPAEVGTENLKAQGSPGVVYDLQVTNRLGFPYQGQIGPTNHPGEDIGRPSSANQDGLNVPAQGHG